VLVFVGYVLLNIGWSFYGYSMADAYGYLAAANGLFVVIPASRNSIWAWLFGLPFDKTITIHRWVGRLTAIEATLHLVLYFTDGYLDSFGTVVSVEKYRNGLIAWIGLMVVFATSIEYLRRKKYNVFYAAHFSFFVFYAFAALHTPKFHFYGYAAMAIYGFDKLQRLARGYASTRQVDSLELLPGDIMRVTVLRPKWMTGVLAPQLGQYVFLQFPEISKYEWHPYTLASSPLEPYFEVDIKKLGDHTAALQAAFKSGSHPKVRIDGPYGKVVINPKRYRSLIFVCGGIGVTPMISMLRWYYLINTPPEVAAKQSIHLAEYIYFVWVVDSRATYEVCKKKILQCVERSKEPGFPTFIPLIHVTRDEPDPAAFGLPQSALFKGRPDMNHILTSMKSNGIKRHAAYCCGPKQLVEQTWEGTSALSDDNIQFAFHHETFEF